MNTAAAPDQELIKAFIEESQEICEQLEELVTQMEEGTADNESFAHFAQRIDSIMGCAKTLGLEGFPSLAAALKNISNLAEGCKMLGYKAAQVQEAESLAIVAAFLFDALELIQASLRDLSKGYVSVDVKHAERVKDRLLWISGKLSLSEEDQKNILKRFGLA